VLDVGLYLTYLCKHYRHQASAHCRNPTNYPPNTYHL